MSVQYNRWFTLNRNFTKLVFDSR